MKRSISILVFCYLLAGCGNNGNSTSSSCIPEDNLDHSRQYFKNIESSRIIYVKYASSQAGDELSSSTVMQTYGIAPGEIKAFDLVGGFNHFYFYDSNAYNHELGKFILKNTQPTISCLSPISVRINGTFTTSEGMLSINNMNVDYFCMRSTQSPEWRNWIFNYPSGNNDSFPFGKCDHYQLPNISPSDKFCHLYFYHEDNLQCPNSADESTNVSKIIFRNTNIAKINVNQLVLR